MKPQKMKAYASFAEWKRDQSETNLKLIDALSRLVKKTAPEFTPSVKWGQGCWILGQGHQARTARGAHRASALNPPRTGT